MKRLAAWLVAVSIAGATRGGATGATCVPSEADDRLKGVVGRMVGREPIWLVDESAGQWKASDARVKTLWVLSRQGSRAFHVTGRRLDAPGTLSFRHTRDSPPVERLSIADPATRSVRPGDVPAERVSNYLFIPTYVMYPSPGCWELTAINGVDEARIVVVMK